MTHAADAPATDAFPAYEVVNADGDPRFLLTCDHASSALPPEYGSLGLPPEEFTRHIAYDPGARGVTLALAKMLGCPAVLSTYSRLLIDPNRGEDNPTLVMKLSDGAIVPGNRHADRAEIQRRIERFHRPYRAQIDAAVHRAIEAGTPPAICAIHSFTPQLRLGKPRPWHVTVLWARDNRLSAPIMRRLRGMGDLCTDENQPYPGALEGDAMWTHALARGLPFALFEIRNDLIQTVEAQQSWAKRLAPVIRGAAAEVDLTPLPVAPHLAKSAFRG